MSSTMPIRDTGLSFAEKQLTKYGWKKGMGLGKNNDGIADAIRVKKRCSRLGMGHDNKEKHQHWWDHAYNRAVNNITVSTTETGIMLVTATDECSITKEKPNLFKSNLLYDNFKQVGTLEGNKFAALKEVAKKTSASDSASSSSSSSDSEDDGDSRSKRGSGLLVDMTDDQLLKLCGGRTLHKAARHGIRMSGKMQRLADVKATEAKLVSKWAEEDVKQDQSEATAPVADRSSTTYCGQEIDCETKNMTSKKAAISFAYDEGPIYANNEALNGKGIVKESVKNKKDKSNKKHKLNDLDNMDVDPVSNNGSLCEDSFMDVLSDNPSKKKKKHKKNKSRDQRIAEVVSEESNGKKVKKHHVDSSAVEEKVSKNKSKKRKRDVEETNIKEERRKKKCNK